MRLDLSQCGRSAAENADLASQAERLGWAGAWVSELSGADAVTTATAAAIALEQGRVGTAILPMQTRNPMLLAMTAASLSHLAPGGFVLGLGTSTPVIIENWHATPWGDSPLQLTRECVDLVRRFLAGERLTTEPEAGGRWQYNRAQLTLEPKEPVPIYIAALNDRMLELAGEIADGVILNFVTVDDVAHAKKQVAKGAERAGRSLDGFEFMAFFRSTALTSEAEYPRVRERYQRELFTYVMAPVYQRMFARDGHADACDEVQTLWRNRQRDEALEAIPQALIRNRTLVGTADDILGQLADFEAAGLDSAMVMPVAIPDADFVPSTLDTIKAIAPPSPS